MTEIKTAEENKLCKGCVVYMKASSCTGYGNAQCVSWVSHEIGELSLFGHNEHYKTYDVQEIVEYPVQSLPVDSKDAREIAQMLFDKREKLDGYGNPVYYEGAKDAAEYIFGQRPISNVDEAAELINKIEKLSKERIGHSDSGRNIYLLHEIENLIKEWYASQPKQN